MKVNKIMTEDIKACRLNDKLEDAVNIMWHGDCGVLPIVNEKNKLVGIVTDRDIAMAIGTRNQLASEIIVSDFATRKIVTCTPQEKIKKILKKMAKYQIKRIPVVEKTGKLVGMISMVDILRSTSKKSVRKRVLKTLTAIGKPYPISLEEI